MTDTVLTAVARAPHADGLAVFDGVLGVLQLAGWTRRHVDTFDRPECDWVVRHHFSAGTWELHFELDRAHRLRNRPPYVLAASNRIAKIDLSRPPLPTVAQVVSELFGPHHHLGLPPRTGNGSTDLAGASHARR